MGKNHFPDTILFPKSFIPFIQLSPLQLVLLFFVYSCGLPLVQPFGAFLQENNLQGQ